MTRLASRALSLTLVCLSLAACKEPPQAGPTPASSAPEKAAATATANHAPSPSVATSAGAPPPSSDPTAGKAVAQKHGGDYWAVYTAKGAKQDEPAVKASIDALTKRGLEFGQTFGFGSVECDVGAAAALKAGKEANVLGVYFANEADAKAFAATLAPGALGIVKIKAMCRD